MDHNMANNAVENTVEVNQLFAVLGDDDSLTLLALPDGSSLGVLFTSQDLARDFIFAYDVAPADIVELTTQEELQGIALSYQSIDVQEAVLDPSTQGQLHDEYIIDFDEVLTTTFGDKPDWLLD
jgi:hypothetical protein